MHTSPQRATECALQSPIACFVNKIDAGVVHITLYRTICQQKFRPLRLLPTSCQLHPSIYNDVIDAKTSDVSTSIATYSLQAVNLCCTIRWFGLFFWVCGTEFSLARIQPKSPALVCPEIKDVDVGHTVVILKHHG